MRNPRFFRPNQIHDATVRCLRSEFRLLPTETRTNRLIFALAKAQQRFPGIEILALCQMSNHLHLVVFDTHGQMSAFMQAFLSPFAKTLNKLDKVRGSVFQRRFTALPIVDHDAVIKRIAYAVTNPVDAGLVRSHKAWTGLVGWAGDFEPRTVTYFHEHRYNKAREEAALRNGEDQEVKREDFEETVTLKMGSWEGLDLKATQAAIDKREREVRAQHRRFLGMAKVLNRSPFHRPKWSKLSARPLCLWTCRAAKAKFMNEWFAFLRAFREASARFRQGHLNVEFPLLCHRPSMRVQ